MVVVEHVQEQVLHDTWSNLLITTSAGKTKRYPAQITMYELLQSNSLFQPVCFQSVASKEGKKDKNQSVRK